MRRPVLVVGAARMLVCLLIGALLVLVAPSVALATVGHQFLSSLSEAPIGTSLSAPGAVAVDQASGEVFVADAPAGTVDVYSSSGAYAGQFGAGTLDPVGIAVDEASGLVFVVDARADAVLVFRPDRGGEYGLVSKWFGELLPGEEFGRVAGVAVDNSSSVSAGDVYVLDGKDRTLGEGAVDVFRPKTAVSEEGSEGELVRQVTAGRLESPNGIAVSGASGRVLVADSVKGAIYAYSPEGALEGKLTGKGSPYGAFAREAPVGDVAAVTVDGVGGDVYVAEAERHVVSQYGPAGEWRGWIADAAGEGLVDPDGLALNGAGEVFVSDAALNVVDCFGPGIAVPGVETGKVARSSLTRTTAPLSGTVDGEGEAAKYRFQYGETAALGSETAVLNAGTGEEPVSIPVAGLRAGTVYYYRIVGEGEAGADYGIVRQLETPPAVTGLETGDAANLVSEGATVTGSLKREALATRYYFQYGPSEAYGSTSSLGEVPRGADEKEEKQPRTVEAKLSGLAVNTTYHYRLVAENEFGTTYGGDRTFTTSGPPRITYEPVAAIGQEQATLPAQIDPDGSATSYRVQYGATQSYGNEAPGGELASGSTPVGVEMVLSGLNVGRTYHFRIVAENATGQTYGGDQTFTTLASAPVSALFATGVSSDEAILHGEIDPLGHDTHYYFRYGAESCNAGPSACTEVPAPPGEDLGAGTEAVAGEARLSGLTPGTTYRYRAIATNSLGITESAEHTFTTTQSPNSALPDNRAWEMVTPPNKQGAPVEALTREGGIVLSAEDGDSLTYVVDGALDEAAEDNRSPEMQQVLARREADGWRSEDVATPNSKAKGIVPGATPEYQFFSPDLSTALVQPPLGTTTQAEPPLAEGVNQATMYLRDNTTGTYLPLVTEANVALGVTFGGEISFLDATPDLTHVVFESGVGLTGPFSTPGLYEWTDGAISQVSVRPNGRPVRGLVELGYSHTEAGAVSSDGSRVIWTTVEEEPKLGHLYMRDTARAETLQLDAAQGAPEPTVAGMARFQGASSDGARVFFTDRQRLTADSTAEPVASEREQYGEPDLYVCEVAVTDGRLACNLKDLTVDHNTGEHADVQGTILGVSEEGTSVYLVARGVLANNEGGDHEHALAGGDNLYELHLDGAQWLTTFIATLSHEDSPEWEANAIANTAYLTARVSPNGRYLALMSAASLTGYENVDANPEAKDARDQEVYLYDAQDASLTCASCNPSGARPEGVLDTEGVGEGLGLLVDRRKVWFGHWLAGNIPGWTAENLTGALYQSRYLSDDGRLFFNSPDDLVGAATNHKEDVYEYEPAGVGSCASASGGCVSLISSGSSSKESAFLEATPEGSNVFFITAAQLLPQDTDTAFDIYDARECTASSPCLTPPVAPEAACAETNTCRPAAPAVQIAAGPAGTATASGAGNAVPQQPAAAKGGVQAKRTVQPLTRAQQLARALAACRKRYPHTKRRRTTCERAARGRYDSKRAASKAKREAKPDSRSRRAARGSTRSAGGGK